MPGRLFTDYFLTEGITTTARWNASSVPISEFRCAAAEAYAKLDGYDRPNEAVTEQELIIPVLELLGWADHLPQQGASRQRGHTRQPRLHRYRVQRPRGRLAQHRAV